MKLNFYFFALEVNVKAGSFAKSKLGQEAKKLVPEGFKALTTKTAVASELDQAWTELIWAWDVAPEALMARKGLSKCKPIGDIIKGALAGAAMAALEGQPNPLASLEWKSTGSSLSTGWDVLAKKISSGRALDEESPYRHAREILGNDLGEYGSCIEKDGVFDIMHRDVLKSMDPALMVAKVDELARRAEVALLTSVAPAPAPAPSTRLRM